MAPSYLCKHLLLLFGLAVSEAHHKTTAEVLHDAGYPVEVHHVTTKDGYILELDRIPRPGKTVVFLANQIYGSATAYLAQGKGRALGFLLYDAGFDVWMGNFRGTPLSCRHTHLNCTNDTFWKFGWQENGALDNPALIEHVLGISGRPQILFAGHSMGGTSFFVMASERPDLLKRIRAAFLFAPAVFMTHTRDEHLLALLPIANETQRAAEIFQNHKDTTELLRKFVDSVCVPGSVIMKNPKLEKICRSVGPGPIHHFPHDSNLFFPKGASVWQILHFVQLSDPNWPGFRKFNYGSRSENKAQYGSETPPDFDINHVETPIFLYNGYGDTTSTFKDQTLLHAALPNVKRFFYSENKSFNHNDFVRSPNAARDVWHAVVNDMKNNFDHL